MRNNWWKHFIIRLSHWEYWNSTLVYFPLYLHWLYYSIRARSFYFLTSANPSIHNGGFIMESKLDVYHLIPQKYYPTTLYVTPDSSLSSTLKNMKEMHLSFPVIAKPDYGERGLAVKKINNELELVTYLTYMQVPFLLQEYISYENEVGIFYYRIPGEDVGHISGIVNKLPVAIVGDGVHTVTQLVSKVDRYILQWKQIVHVHADKLDTILPKGQRLVLIPYGNHARGSLFINESKKITPQLVNTIHRICRQIPDFYYGRIDIRFDSWELLEQGKNFSIIELNGSGSEPTHIYDPSQSIFYAWKEILKHWKILYKISSINNRNGTPYVSMKRIKVDIQEFKKIEKLLSAKIW
jgi:hypothetical protein